jgi:hypothetical protein
LKETLMSNAEFVNIPVPKELVVATYAFLAGQTKSTSPSSGWPGDVGEAWTVDDLRAVAQSRQPSLRRITSVLDHLAAKPGVWVSLTEVATRIDVTPGQLSGALSGFTKWIKSTRGEDNPYWPIEVVYGNGPGDQAHYSMSEVVAERWRQARAS